MRARVQFALFCILQLTTLTAYCTAKHAHRELRSLEAQPVPNPLPVLNGTGSTDKIPLDDKTLPEIPPPNPKDPHGENPPVQSSPVDPKASKVPLDEPKALQDEPKALQDKPKVAQDGPEALPAKIDTSAELEPVVSPQQASAKDQKVTKKELNSSKNETTPIENPTQKVSNSTTNITNVIKNSTVAENDLPMKINLTPNNDTIIGSENGTKQGAYKRGFIVFGTLAFIVIAYISFKRYRRGKSSHSNEIFFDASDSQQYKYGVLKSNEMNDNLEMSNIPLTIDSSDDDELEIFDLEGKVQYNKANPRNTGVNGRLLVKDDVEILDLNIPGYSRSAAQRNVYQDEDLLDLDDALDDVLKSSVKKNDTVKDDKTEKNDNFFNIL